MNEKWRLENGLSEDEIVMENLPSPDEIRRRAADIRATHSDVEQRKRQFQADPAPDSKTVQVTEAELVMADGRRLEL